MADEHEQDVVDFTVEEPLDTSELLLEDFPAEESSVRSEVVGDDPTSQPKVGEKRYENKFGSFATGFDVMSEEAEKRRNERAKRFGFEGDSEGNKEEEEFRVDVEQMKKKIEKIKKPMGSVRPEAIFLFGTDNMSTNEVLNIFKVYGPSCIEWIDDSSCNVVWDDGDSATRALLRLGKTIVCKVECQAESRDVEMCEENPNKETELKPLSKENEETETTEMAIEEISDNEEKNVPDEEEEDGDCDHWRVGPCHRKASALLIRRARTGDRKETGASKRSRYYLLHGNPNLPGQPRGISTGKLRMLRKRRREGDDDDDEVKSKPAAAALADECMTEMVDEHGTKRDSRLRMRADDEIRGIDAWDRDGKKTKTEAGGDDGVVRLPPGLPRGDLRGKLRPHRDLRKVLESRRDEERPVGLKIKARLEKDSEGDRQVVIW